MRLKSMTTIGEKTDVKKHIYSENFREADDFKSSSEGLFCIDYSISRSFYLMGSDFGSLGGNVESMNKYSNAFSKCFDDYFESVKKNPTILTKKDFFEFINTNFKEYEEAKKEWGFVCTDAVDIIVEYFNDVLLEVSPIEIVTKKCNFNFLLYNPFTFYDKLYEACTDLKIPASVVVMNDLWDDDNYIGCIERMKYHLMMYSALKEKSISLEKFIEKEKEKSLEDIYFDDVKRIFELRLKESYNECKRCEERLTCDHNYYWRYVEAEKEKKRIEQENKKKEKLEKKLKKKNKKVVNKQIKNVKPVKTKDTIRNIDEEIKKVLHNESILEDKQLETEQAISKDKQKEPVYIPKESLEIVRPARRERKDEYFNNMNKHIEKSQKTTVTYQSYLKDESLMKVSKRKISKLNINDNFLTQLNKTTD